METIQIDQDYTLLSNITKSKNIHSFILDTGAPHTLMGIQEFKKLYREFPKSISIQFEFHPSNKQFVFGGGEKSRSMGLVMLPLYFKDEQDYPHLIKLSVEILDIDIVMLLGSKSLSKAGAVIDLVRNTLVLENACDDATRFPLALQDSGHYHLQCFPMSEEEGRHASEILFSESKWSDNYVKDIVSYVQSSKEPQIDKIIKEDIYLNRVAKRRKRKASINKKTNIQTPSCFWAHWGGKTWCFHQESGQTR